jgi:hypothetical protein
MPMQSWRLRRPLPPNSPRRLGYPAGWTGAIAAALHQ